MYHGPCRWLGPSVPHSRTALATDREMSRLHRDDGIIVRRFPQLQCSQHNLLFLLNRPLPLTHRNHSLVISTEEILTHQTVSSRMKHPTLTSRTVSPLNSGAQALSPSALMYYGSNGLHSNRQYVCQYGATAIQSIVNHAAYRYQGGLRRPSTRSTLEPNGRAA